MKSFIEFHSVMCAFDTVFKTGLLMFFVQREQCRCIMGCRNVGPMIQCIFILKTAPLGAICKKPLGAICLDY